VPPHVIFAGHSPVWRKIRELKFLQEQEGELIARIAKAPSFSEREIEGEILEELYKRLDEEQFNVRITFVDRIPRTGSRAKMGLLEQRLPITLKDVAQAKGAE